MLVLDCSAAIEIVNKTKHGNMLRALMKESEAIIAPELFIYEATQVSSKFLKAKLLDFTGANALLINAISLVDEFVDMREYTTECLNEATRNSHSTYDMFYLTLARRNGATLFTLDRKLIAICENLGVDCVHVLDA